jgi:hypothetical protein
MLQAYREKLRRLHHVDVRVDQDFEIAVSTAVTHSVAEWPAESELSHLEVTAASIEQVQRLQPFVAV